MVISTLYLSLLPKTWFEPAILHLILNSLVSKNGEGSMLLSRALVGLWQTAAALHIQPL